MRESLGDILKELGWDTGFRIPIANEENQQLEAEVMEKTRKKIKLVEKLEKNEKRIESIEQHINSINVEHSYNQKLLTAYIAQHEAENHLHAMSEHEKSSITQEIRHFEKEKNETNERISLMMAELKKLNDKLNLSKETVAIDKVTFQQWQEWLNREQEDQGLIEKYMKLDKKNFKQLELKRQKLSVELENYRQSIIKIMGDVCEKKIILQTTSRFYIETLEERRQLIDRWTQSVLVLRQRDRGIEQLSREIHTLKDLTGEKTKSLTESTQFMERQVNFNKELDNSIKKLEKKLAFLKEHHLKMSEKQVIDNIEMITRKRSLNDISQQTQNLKNEIKNTNTINFNNRQKIDDLETQINELQLTLDKVKNHSINVEEKTKQLMLMIQSEEKRKRAITRETKRFQDSNAQVTGKISHLQDEQKVIKLQRKGLLRNIELTVIAQAKEDKLLMEKKEMIYQLTLQIRNCDIQLGKNEGIDNKSEMEHKLQTIESLQDTLSDKKEIAKLLQRQINNLEYEIKKVQLNMSQENQELEKLKNKKQNLELLIESSEKSLQITVNLNEEKQVTENILELRVTQAEEMVKNTGNKVYNLERCQLQIQTAMKERIAELKVLHGGQNTQNKLLSNECCELREVLNERHNQIQNLHSKYDKIIATSTISAEDCEGPLSTAFLRIRNAQEKFELQEQGDKLDAKIRRTEAEIKSMENTLRVVNVCNERYKVSLGSVEDDHHPNEQMKLQLENELTTSLEQLKKIKSQLQNCEKEFLNMQNEHEDLLENLKKIREEKETKLKNINLLERQIGEQKGRIMRADSRLRKLYNDIQQLYQCSNYETICLQEKDIATRELEEINYLSLQRITEFTICHLEAEAYVKKLLAGKKIVLPAEHSGMSPSPIFPANSERSSTTASYNVTRKIKNNLQRQCTRMSTMHQPRFVLETVSVGESSIINSPSSVETSSYRLKKSK